MDALFDGACMSRYRSKRDWERKTYEHESILSRHQGEGAFPIVLILDHLKAGFNVGKIIRSAHAFGVREVHLVGIEAFDPAPAKGTFRKTRTRVFESVAESFRSLIAEGYTIFSLDADAEECLGWAALPERSAFVVGHEEYGLSFASDEFPELRRLKIPQFGQVESLNVSVAASLALFEYSRQRGFTPPANWEPASSVIHVPAQIATGAVLPLP